MSLCAIDILKRLAETGYFRYTGYDAEKFRRTVSNQLNLEPHQALQLLVHAGYVEMDHGPNPHPMSYIDRWRLTITKSGLAALLDA